MDRVRTTPAATGGIRPQTLGMRLNYLSSTVLCFLAGLSLFVAPEHTDQLSAWTIAVPITAAFLGAAYWGAGLVLTLLSALERTWARARLAYLPPFVFSVLNLGATVLHLDRFHLQSDNLFTLLLTYLWLAPYAVGWMIGLVILVRQLRVPGGDPPSAGPLPPWLRAVLGVQSAVLILVGVVLFVAPQAAPAVWPWALTALTARTVAAWLVGVGIGAAQTVWENAWDRVYAAALCYTGFAALELIVLIRYPGALDWGSPQTWLYVLLLLSILLAGAYTWWGARRRRVAGPVASSPLAAPAPGA